MSWPKCPETETAQTETTPTETAQIETAQIETARPKSPVQLCYDGALGAWFHF